VDLRRMGMGGGMGRWMQLTSGMHAVLMFFRLCDSVSLYGFSTYRCATPLTLRRSHLVYHRRVHPSQRRRRRRVLHLRSVSLSVAPSELCSVALT